MKNRNKVVVGLSGGVDSATSAALLVEQGYAVTGVFLECWRASGCRVDEDRKDAMDVALDLGIPFKVLDFKKEYKKKVVEYFFSEYQAGRTPNPDTMCNKEIKFGMFYDWAMSEGFDFVATGHYARIKNDQLLMGVDKNKDQSYFLYQLRADQLKHILFPIGDLNKSQVRKEADKRGLKVAKKPDSQGICFIGPIDVRKFLETRITPKKGGVINVNGEVMGSHDGVWFYTVGQRHGFTIDGKYKSKSGKWKQGIPPLYVISKDVKKNQLMVGEKNDALVKEFEVGDIHWINLKPEIDNLDLLVRIRHGGKLISSKLMVDNSKLKVELSEPQRGVATGQAVVFYQKEVCLGGGIINS